jgi:hypothetical protein
MKGLKATNPTGARAMNGKLPEDDVQRAVMRLGDLEPSVFAVH